ncbi:MAG: isoprenylcysteine carboxylmethyltransferase family protein [Anaerolineae bacterium]|nr:isoprenylcysteine carboxylmethyltransferase family protein [Anaerolineae bacterium]
MSGPSLNNVPSAKITKEDYPALYRSALGFLILLSFTGSVLFISYGSIQWPEAWVVLGLWLLYYVIVFVWASQYNPGVILARARSLEHQPLPWDKKILGGQFILGVTMNILAGLDAGRFGWSQIPGGIRWGMFPLVLFTLYFPFWAVAVNPFASAVVRIQKERGHHVISAGPYRYIRHPMYLTSVTGGLAFPLFYGSWWALIPGVLNIALALRRTQLEDTFLQSQLPGYKEYARQVKYRIFPGVW